LAASSTCTAASPPGPGMSIRRCRHTDNRSRGASMKKDSPDDRRPCPPEWPAGPWCRPDGRVSRRNRLRRAVRRRRARRSTPAAKSCRRAAPACCRPSASPPARPGTTSTARRRMAGATLGQYQVQHQRLDRHPDPAPVPLAELGRLQPVEAAVAQAEAQFGLARQDLICARRRPISTCCWRRTPGDGAGAEGGDRRAARIGQAQFRGRHRDHHRQHEAQARFDLTSAQEIAAQNDLTVKRQALRW
jgi:hypothetical protein